MIKTKEATPEVAQAVLDGEYGNGPWKADKLIREGYDPKEVLDLAFKMISSQAKKPELKSYTETSHRMKTGRYEVTEDFGLYIFEAPNSKSRRVHYYDISGSMLDKVSTDGRVKNGASVMIVNLVSEGDRVWGKTPSGWICVRDHGRVCAKKV